MDANTVIQVALGAFGMSGFAFGVGRVVVYFGEKSLEQKFGAVGIRDRLAACAKLEAALEGRREERAKEIKAASAAFEEATRKKRELERSINDAIASGETLVRVIGEETKGSTCFYSEVYNKYVAGGGFEQKQNAYIDPSWAAPQTMEIWTRSVAEARTEIERRYPPAFGYVVSRLLDKATAETMKPPK